MTVKSKQNWRFNVLISKNKIGLFGRLSNIRAYLTTNIADSSGVDDCKSSKFETNTRKMSSVN